MFSAKFFYNLYNEFKNINAQRKKVKKWFFKKKLVDIVIHRFKKTKRYIIFDFTLFL